MTGFLVAFAGHLMGNVVADDNVVLAERKAVVVVVDTCVVVDRAAGACKEAVPADKMIVVVVGKAVVGMVAADGSLVVDKDAAVCNVVVLVGSHLVVDKEVVDKGVVAVDTGEGMVVADHTVKDLAGEALDERNAEDAVSGHSTKKKKLKSSADASGRVDCILSFISLCYLLCRKYVTIHSRTPSTIA